MILRELYTILEVIDSFGLVFYLAFYCVAPYVLTLLYIPLLTKASLKEDIVIHQISQAWIEKCECLGIYFCLLYMCSMCWFYVCMCVFVCFDTFKNKSYFDKISVF